MSICQKLHLLENLLYMECWRKFCGVSMCVEAGTVLDKRDNL